MAVRRLDPSRAYKPLDVGEAGVAASVDGYGRLVYVGQDHPEHGVVVLTASSPFPEALRHDSSAVRRHRRRYAARNAAAFGLAPAGEGRRTQGPALLLEDAVPAVSLDHPERSLLATFVPHPDDTDGTRGVLQVALGVPPRLEWKGSIRLARADYPELTEGAPLPPLTLRTKAERCGEDGAVVEDQRLGWAVALSADRPEAIRLARRGERATLQIPLGPGVRAVALGLGADAAQALAGARRLAALDPEEALERALARWRSRWTGWPSPLGPLDGVVRRALAYLLGCCAIPVGETICLVTDHRILPLAWTRDGYYAARALLAWTAAGGPAEAGHIVRRHLDWLFETAERPEGWWARSHLVGGQRKDPAFQLDQQLYPLLELCDYVELSGDRAPLDHHARHVEPVLEAIERRRAAHAPLYASEENPADDPLELPYQTASQILAWRTFSRLDRLGLGGGRLGELAKRIALAVREHQIVPGPDGRPLFAYATDLQGDTRLYHDANDLPLALAPSWGFCAPDDQVWRTTVAFALSPANPGFFAGAHGGLGSLHTPAPWPLGHVQSLLVGRATGNGALLAASERALVQQALWDGALPEASDSRSGLPLSRPWFAWPGAAIAADVLGSLPGAARALDSPRPRRGT